MHAVKARVLLPLSFVTLATAVVAPSAFVLTPGCNPCPPVCSEICAGRPEPLIPPGCPIPECVCRELMGDAGTDPDAGM